jgi:hypothetical protein
MLNARVVYILVVITTLQSVIYSQITIKTFEQQPKQKEAKIMDVI